MTHDELMKAFDACAELLKKDPTNLNAYIGAAKIAARVGKWDEAAQLAKSALSRGSNDFTIESQRMLGVAHQILGDHAQRNGNFIDATSRYNTAIMHNPTDVHTLSSMGLLEDKLGRSDKALEFYMKAYDMDKADPTIRFNLGCKQLAAGSFFDGWRNYHARHEMLIGQGGGRTYHCQSLQTALHIDGRVFLWADQGIGEQIMFSKFLHDIYDICHADITMEVALPLVPVFRRSFPFLQDVVSTQPTLSPDFMKKFDGHMSLADAVGGFVNKFDAIDKECNAGKNNFGWITADPQRVRNVSQGFPGNKFKLGLSWSSPKSKDTLKKGIPLPELHQLFDMEGVQAVSCQYGLTPTDLTYIGNTKKYPITSMWSENMDGDVEGLIAKIASCDLIVTISNATAHIAGALGIPTILMVPVGYGCHWHWFYDRTDSPWYSSVTIIRQKKVGEWEPVIKEVVESVKTIVQQSGSRAA